MKKLALALSLLLLATPALAEPVERTLLELPSELPPGVELILVSEQPGAVHWGVQGWQTPPAALRPAGTVGTGGPAVETPLRGPGPDGKYRATLGPFTAQTGELNCVLRHPNGWSAGRDGKDARVAIRAGAQARRRPITIGRGPYLGTSGKLDRYEHFMDWEHADLRALDPADDARSLGDAKDHGRDLLAFYSRLEEGALYLRADMLDFGVGDESGAMDLVVLLDWEQGGQTWLPAFHKGQTATGWEAAILIKDKGEVDVFDATWNLLPAGKNVHLRSDLDAIEAGVNLDVLRRAGWDGRAPLRFAAYTVQESSGVVADAVGEADLSDGVLDTWIRADARAGTAKYSAILHGNQNIQPLKWLDDLIESRSIKTPNGNPTGYARALDAHTLFRLPVNIHVSGTLAGTVEWGAPAFNERLRGFLDGHPENGEGHLIGGVLAEHIMPYFENARSHHGGEGANAATVRLNDELLDRIYGQSPRSVFWIPERVTRGTTFADVIADASGKRNRYDYAVVDQVTHVARWFGHADAHSSKGHKVNRINGVKCFLINDEADQWKFANSDGGLWIWTRRGLIDKALDPDQEQLTLVFDDWEAYAGRSFTSFGVGSDNPDNYETTLRWIANHPWIQVETLETIAGWNWTPVERGDAPSLSIQTYEWLDHATEESYDNWYYGSAQEESFKDYHLERTPGVRVPKPYGVIDQPGGVLHDVWKAVATAPQGRLQDLAAAVFAVDVFETAWHDEDMNDYLSKTSTGDYLNPDTTYDPIAGWARAMHSRVGDAGVVAAAARWSANPPSAVRAWRADVDEDGELELLLADQRAFYAFENDGGRCVFAAVRDPATGEAEPFLGTLLNTPGTIQARELEETREDAVTRAPALLDWWADRGGSLYVNADYRYEARSDGWRLRSPDGRVEKIVTLSEGKLRVRYTLHPNLGTLYVRCGLTPALLDLFLGGESIQAARRSDGARVASAKTKAGRRVEVALLPQAGATLIDNAAFGAKGAMGVPFSYQVELSGTGSFGFEIQPQLK